MMQVIGEDGSVQYIDVDGDDDDDDDVGSVLGMLAHQNPQIGAILGALKAQKKKKARIAVRKANFRQGQLAPGVQAPDQGMLPLPMQGIPSNTFALATQAITFQGQVQKPYRGERFLVEVVRTGATAIGRLLGLVFAGTDLQQADITSFDMETIGRSDAFGVRLTMTPIQPGVLLRVPVTLSNAIAGTDTIFTSMTCLGRVVH